MFKKFVAILIVLSIIACIPVAEGEVLVGVKEGDWIEYEVTTTGVPMEGHNIVWTRMDILEVQGKEFRANVTSESQNGSIWNIIRAFNFEEGQVSGWVIIPANLGPGDSFYDAYLDRNITIEGEEKKTVAGALRTITYANTPDRHKEWDKSTGIFVETFDILENYTVNATLSATNLWSHQIYGLDQNLFYAIMITVIIIAVAIIGSLILILYRRKKK
jgi:hypothetical protein